MFKQRSFIYPASTQQNILLSIHLPFQIESLRYVPNHCQHLPFITSHAFHSKLNSRIHMAFVPNPSNPLIEFILSETLLRSRSVSSLCSLWKSVSMATGLYGNRSLRQPDKDLPLTSPDNPPDTTPTS